MRVAPIDALHDDVRPVLIAHLAESEVERLFPVHFSDLDSSSAAEPSRAALLRLDAGSLVVIEYGTITSRLTVSVPEYADLAETLVDLWREAPLPEGAVDWVADEVETPSEVFASEDPSMLAFELRRTIEKKRKQQTGEDTQTRFDSTKPQR